MKTVVLKALKASIAHWKRLLAGKERRGEAPDSESCALCALFDDGDYGCRACPVGQKTKDTGCYGSPWMFAYSAYYNRGDGESAAEREWKTAAKLQLAFLKSLLPRKERKACRAKK